LKAFWSLNRCGADGSNGKSARSGAFAVAAEYKKNKRYIHIKIKVPNIPSHRTFNRNSGQAGQLPVLVSEF
jgi:hypothetical protein